LEKSCPSQAEIAAQAECVENEDLNYYMLKKGQEDYEETLEAINDTLHPFRMEASKAQTSAEVERGLLEEAQKLEEIAWLHDVEDRQEGVEKFRNQSKDLSSGVDVWWTWAVESLAVYALEKDKVNWLLYVLLPVCYWHRQIEKTQNSGSRKKYKRACEGALAVLQAHPLTLMLPLEELKQSGRDGHNGWPICSTAVHQQWKVATAGYLKCTTMEEG
jgi:hypothetical protein